MRLIELFEPALGVLVPWNDIGVIFTGQLTVCALDVLIRGVSAHSERFVVVMIFHMLSACTGPPVGQAVRTARPRISID